jgi:hypothetical protein
MKRLAVVCCTVSAALLTAGLAGCASVSPSASTPPSGTRTGVPGVNAPLLATASVPGLPSRTHGVTVRLLAEDASINGLADEITQMGFVAGQERIFQGNSKYLTFVDSRALTFRTPAGAAAYVEFVRDHASAFFGAFPSVASLSSEGRTGWVFTPEPCACHLANPALVGVVHDERFVLWLEINGPAATGPVLSALFGRISTLPT